VGVDLRGGRRASFEVTFNDEVIHSKLDTQEWPDTEKVLEAIAKRLSSVAR
jgi:selT/selW/selH-like putative selenoprotein